MKPLFSLLILLLLFGACNSKRQCLEDGWYVFKFGDMDTTRPDIELTGDSYTFFRKGQIREQGRLDRLPNCRYRFTTERFITDSARASDKRPGDRETWKISSSQKDTFAIEFSSQSQSGKGWIVRINKKNR